MITIAKAALLLNVNQQRIRVLCRDGRIRGARKVGRDWVLPDRPVITPATHGPPLRGKIAGKSQ